MIVHLLWLLFACGHSGDDRQAAGPPRTAADTIDWKNPTESFKGTLKGKQIVFSHKDYQVYRLETKGKETYGHLNTERGYGDDPDATVFILDDDKPKKEQRYFARLSSGSVYMLDKDRAVMDDVNFYIVKKRTQKK